MMSKANLLKYAVTWKKLLVPKEPTSLVHAWCTQGNSSPYTICRCRGSLRFPSHTHPLQVSSLWKSRALVQAAVSPAPPACCGGEERLHRVVMCASSPLAPRIPGILSNTSHCYIMEWGRIFWQFIPHQKGFILVFLVAIKGCGRHNVSVMQEEPSPCQQVELSLSWGCRQVWPATLLPDTHSRAPGECPCLSPLPSVPTGTSQLPATAGRRKDTLKLMGLSCNIFLFLCVIDFPLRGYLDHTCIRGTWECSAEKVEKYRGWGTIGSFWQRYWFIP